MSYLDAPCLRMRGMDTDGYVWTREWTRGKINAQPTDAAAEKFYVAFKRILHSMLTEFLLERI